jgi:hypothetical protein
MKHLSIDPVIHRTVCCPKCYTQYTLANLPDICSFKAKPHSWPCKTPLWTVIHTRGGPRRVPRRLYSVQDLKSWLEYFLSRAGIEDLIDQSYAHNPNNEIMESIWDSPAWRSLGPFTTTPGNLTFGVYVDWFNPLTNKIAGKTVSCGAIIFFCLNLPYHLQHLPENTYFAGITPPPKEPSVKVMTQLSNPIITFFEQFWEGIRVRTHRHPLGITKKGAVLPGMGDLLAMRKFFGLASVSSLLHFCSFCKLCLQDIDSLAVEQWQPRIGAEVRAAAEEARTTSTVARQEAIFAEHGVRWAAPNRLTYRDPIRHLVLGIMHNWLEGVLQHHMRLKWRIGIPSSHSKPSKPTNNDGGASDIGDEESDGATSSAGESDGSGMDLDPGHSTSGSETSLLHQNFETNMVIRGGDSEDDSDDTEKAFPIAIGPVPPSSDSEQSEPNGDSLDENVDISSMFTASHSQSKPIFNTQEMALLHHGLSDVVIPSWIERPPTNLGDKTHGKLKAEMWLILFTVFLPLIMPEIFLSSGSDFYAQLLDNFVNLVACTNIVCAHRTCSEWADLYMTHYICYRQSSKILFPTLSTRPNHHFAMHIGDMLKFWGPLIKLSEFGGERHNGRMQKVKTNRHERRFTAIIIEKLS